MMTKEKICGVYCIENLVNGKKYIGQSIDIKLRWMQHKRDSIIVRDTFLYNSIRKHGMKNFKFYILELCDECSLNDKEIYWIDYYNTYKNGYNMTLGGAGLNSGQRKSKQNKLPNNFILLNSSIDEVVPIVKLDTNFNTIKIYNSVQECAREENVPATNISKTACGKHKTCEGFVFMYLNDIINMTVDEIKNYRLKQRKACNYSSSHSTAKRKIKQLDENGELINIFNSINEASRYLNIDASSITKVCKGRLKQTKGYKFEYY